MAKIKIERGQDRMKKVADWNCDWTTVGSVKAVKGPILRRSWRWPGEGRTLHRWADRVNGKLFELAATLPSNGIIYMTLPPVVSS